jgi:hypothetical protein
VRRRRLLAHSDADGNRDGQGYGDSDSDSDGNRYFDSDSYFDGNRYFDSDSYFDSDGHGYFDSHGYGYADAYLDAETYAYAAGSTDAETFSDTGAAPDDQAALADSNSDRHGHSESDGHGHGHSDSHSHSDRNSNRDSNADRGACRSVCVCLADAGCARRQRQFFHQHGTWSRSCTSHGLLQDEWHRDFRYRLHAQRHIWTGNHSSRPDRGRSCAPCDRRRRQRCHHDLDPWTRLFCVTSGWPRHNQYCQPLARPSKSRIKNHLLY